MNKKQAADFKSLNIAILTISDSRSLADDLSGDLLVERLTQCGHQLAKRALVKDDKGEISTIIADWITQIKPHIIITTGGTGFTGRDVTPDAIEPMFDKKMDGFSFLFHQISYQSIGIVTMQSRATAGLIGETFVFCLPGSKNACRDAWDNILAQALDSRHQPSNLVELMPRLAER